MTRQQVVDAIRERESAGKFDQHVDPAPPEMSLPVDENYRYFGERTFFEGVKYRLEKFFMVWPFAWYQNKFVLKTRFVGKKNLKGLKAAVLTCNHVQMFDCLAVKYGACPRRTFIVGASFNNMKGLLGELMRAGDMVPLNTTMRGKINFAKAIRRILEKKEAFLLLYPETAMWWHYRKPRPYQTGAFSIAAKYRIPVVPEFITYRDLPKKDKEGFPLQQLTVHIGKPIYPREDLDHKANMAWLSEQAFQACKKVYEETYGIPLTYTCDKREDATHE